MIEAMLGGKPPKKEVDLVEITPPTIEYFSGGKWHVEMSDDGTSITLKLPYATLNYDLSTAYDATTATLATADINIPTDKIALSYYLGKGNAYIHSSTGKSIQINSFYLYYYTADLIKISQTYTYTSSSYYHTIESGDYLYVIQGAYNSNNKGLTLVIVDTVNDTVTVTDIDKTIYNMGDDTLYSRGIMISNDGKTVKTIVQNSTQSKNYNVVIDLSTAFDLSTASLTSSTEITNYPTLSGMLYFTTDGNHFIVQYASNYIRMYECSTPFSIFYDDVTELSYTTVYKGGADTAGSGFVWGNSDIFYIQNNSKDIITKTSSSTAYEFTINEIDFTAITSTGLENFSSVHTPLKLDNFNNDGTKLYWFRGYNAYYYSNLDLVIYDLSTPYDLTTASINNTLDGVDDILDGISSSWYVISAMYNPITNSVHVYTYNSNKEIIFELDSSGVFTGNYTSADISGFYPFAMPSKLFDDSGIYWVYIIEGETKILKLNTPYTFSDGFTEIPLSFDDTGLYYCSRAGNYVYAYNHSVKAETTRKFQIIDNRS